MTRAVLEALLGDLQEESRLHGRGWLAQQILRSVPYLIGMTIRHSPPILIASLLTAALPVLLLDRLWAFTHSLIPWKAGIERSPEILAASAAVLCACTVLGGFLRVGGACIPALASALTLSATVASLPAGSGAAVFALVLASWKAGARLRRRKEIAC